MFSEHSDQRAGGACWSSAPDELFHQFLSQHTDAFLWGIRSDRSSRNHYNCHAGEIPQEYGVTIADTSVRCDRPGQTPECASSGVSASLELYTFLLKHVC